MTRLTHPTAGTVVEVGDSLAARYRAAGWADPSAQQEQATSEEPDEQEAVSGEEEAAPRRARRSTKR